MINRLVLVYADKTAFYFSFGQQVDALADLLKGDRIQNRSQLAGSHHSHNIAQFAGKAALRTNKGDFLHNDGHGVDICKVARHADENDTTVRRNNRNRIFCGLSASGEVNDNIEILVCKIKNAGLYFLCPQFLCQFLSFR